MIAPGPLGLLTCVDASRTRRFDFYHVRRVVFPSPREGTDECPALNSWTAGRAPGNRRPKRLVRLMGRRACTGSLGVDRSGPGKSE